MSHHLFGHCTMFMLRLFELAYSFLKLSWASVFLCNCTCSTKSRNISVAQSSNYIVTLWICKIYQLAEWMVGFGQVLKLGIRISIGRKLKTRIGFQMYWVSINVIDPFQNSLVATAQSISVISVVIFYDDILISSNKQAPPSPLHFLPEGGVHTRWYRHGWYAHYFGAIYHSQNWNLSWLIIDGLRIWNLASYFRAIYHLIRTSHGWSLMIYAFEISIDLQVIDCWSDLTGCRLRISEANEVLFPTMKTSL